MKKIIVAIDGPAGSGKTTTAREVAKHLNYIYIDTGAMYRAVTLAWLRTKKKMSDTDFEKLMKDIEIKLESTPKGQKTLLNGEDVSDEIRTAIVTQYSSPIAAIEIVRELLVNQQREMGDKGGIVMDGRDIGTTVFPDADLKIFMQASIEARAKRRARELNAKGQTVSVEDIRDKITKRDAFDTNRKISPLRKADDAIELDTSNLTIKEQTKKVVELAKDVINS